MAQRRKETDRLCESLGRSPGRAKWLGGQGQLISQVLPYPRHAVPEGQLLLVKVALSKCQPAESFPGQLVKQLLFKRQKVILEHGAC